ncbi:MAG: hypothetical protein ABR525_06380 [Candidatus Limnocylindria bacterium]
MPSLTRRVAPFAVLAFGAVAAASCGPVAAPGPPAPAHSTGGGITTTATPRSTADQVRVADAAYGSLTLDAPPEASCEVAIRVIPGTRGERPPQSVAVTVGPSGRADVRYPAPRVPAGDARYDVSCGTPSGIVTASVPFTVPSRGIPATGVTVHIVADRGVADGVVDDAALVPVRDAVIARLRSHLAGAWDTATRGLGKLSVVEESADMRIVVAAQRGTSANRTDADSSQDVIIYAEDDSGVVAAASSVSVALHEIGHIWCCHGPGTIAGHWAKAEESPGLLGVDRYGLMNHPVECAKLPSGVESCPDRFSDRELTSMGFAAIPPPIPDSCVVRSLELKAQLADVEGRLDAVAPGSLTTNRAIDAYNALVLEHNAIVDQLQALPCAS